VSTNVFTGAEAGAILFGVFFLFLVVT